MPGAGDFDEYVAWLEREAAAGRDHVPPAADSPEWDDATPWDLAGPRVFDQDSAADRMAPGPLLAVLAEQATADVSALTDDQLSGVLQAARRLQNRAFYQQTLAVAEFGRRRAAQLAADDARRVPPGRRRGEHPDAELAQELLMSRAAAGDLLAESEQLASRLPRTLAGMGDGTIDQSRAGTIAWYTASLGPQDAATADAILAAAAPEIRPDSLARRACALEMKLDPAAARQRREHAKQTRQRVEVRREQSGNASVAGRELDTADAMASKANIHALALRLRRDGMPGTLDALRTVVFNDLLQGRSPLDRVTREPGPQAGATTDGATTDGAPRPADPGPAPMPAVINLLVHAGTLLGWDTLPSQAAGWGLLDSAETAAIVKAASGHPATRWCVTLVGPGGTAAAHGCSAGQHPWPPGEDPPRSPPPSRSPGRAGPSDHPPPGPAQPRRSQPGSQHGPPPVPRPNGSGLPPVPRPNEPDPGQRAQLADLLRRLSVTVRPVAAGTCDHSSAEDRYVPSRKLQHLVRARTAICTAPGCQAQAVYADLDHTVPHPDGLTCQCNLGPKCRTHHRCKQSPGWRVEQPEPGVFRWTLPSGRRRTTRPTVY